MGKKVVAFAAASILLTSYSTNTLAATYVVQKGDTLSKIAKVHKVSIQQIKDHNQLKSDAIFYKQKITIPGPVTSANNPVKPPVVVKQATYKVVKGDSLIKIANKHKITLAELKIWNNLTKDSLSIGQVLKVSPPSKAPAPAPAPGKPQAQTPNSGKAPAPVPAPAPVVPSQPANSSEYTVQGGDSLSKIAMKFQTTVDQLKKANGLKSDLIFVGQKLKITETASSDQGQVEDSVSESLLIEEAKKLLGTPYLFGGSSLDALDCSGFIHYVFNQAGKPIKRLSSEGYYNRSYEIDSPQPGDLIFFKDTYKIGISHMGIYLGNNQFIHASPSNGVEIANTQNAYYQKHFAGYKRFY